MSKEVISGKQGVFMIVMFIIGSSSLMVMGLEAQRDIWIAILIATIVGTAIMFMYARILSMLPGKDLYETLEFFLGKIPSRIFVIITTWFIFDLGAIVLRNFSQFIVTVGLTETPIIVPMASMAATCAIGVKLGIEVLARWTELFITLVLVFIFVGSILLLKYFNFNNLRPVFYNGFGPILKGALGVITFPFGETVAFILAFPAFKKSASLYKIFPLGLLIGSGIIFIMSMAIILVIGVEAASRLYYPAYETLSRINLGEFLQRLEIIAALTFVLSVFLKISVLLMGACKGTARVLGFEDYRFLVIPIAALMVNQSYLSFDNMNEYHQWVFKVWPYYAPAFQIIVPLIILIIIEIKVRRKSPGQRALKDFKKN